MLCELCNGIGEKLVVVKHRHTGISKMASVPCNCMISKVISRENKLLTPLGEQYITPEEMDPELVFNYDDQQASPNFLIKGSYDSLLWNVKALFMQYRFTHPKPRFMFSRSIDILHDFHVPQNDGSVQYLSALSAFDLIVVIFGISEKNQALSSCMTEMVSNRRYEKKPTWIYLLDRLTLASCEQEYSQQMEVVVGSYTPVVLKERNGINKVSSESKNLASNFKVG